MHGYEYQTYTVCKGEIHNTLTIQIAKGTIFFFPDEMVLSTDWQITSVIFRSTHLPASSYSEIVNSVHVWAVFMFRSKPQWKMVGHIHAFFMPLSVQNNRHLFEEIFNRFRGTGHHAYPACKMSAHSVPAHLVSILISVIRHHYANFEEKKRFCRK